MQQLTQKLKKGQIEITNVPWPILGKGMILVRNHYSIISTGTESSTVKTARKGLIGKAKERPQQAKQVIETLKSQGPIQTYRAVMKKLEAYSPLGYSCAGEVIDVASDIKGYRIGDLVACGGATASHAEIVSVPVNLCANLKHDADLKQAAYNTLGAIAMQGVRQADLRLGETCAVIGLGLIGQLTALLLRTSGIRVVGIDIDPSIVETAKHNCLDLALDRNDTGVEERINDYTDGIGCDAVIITAASSSLDPINFSGAIARKKGKIIIVGAVPSGFDREPYYYKKELEVKMSCSYGPGRYDQNYEEKGIDYPVSYVRWTENRNMQAFQELIHSKKIDLNYLTTHCLKLENAPDAYDMIMDKSEHFIGILISYDTGKKIEREKVVVNASKKKVQSVGIGFIGAGSYAQNHLIPNISTHDVSLKGVMTATSASSRSAAERYGFDFCTSEEDDILENSDINTVFIASRHNSHAEFVLKSLKAGKNIFVEKPLCLDQDEFKQIFSTYQSLMTNNQSLILMVGYNRRFAPLTQKIKEKFGDGAMSMIYRINAGNIPADSWIQDLEIGGGRILGEVCHFVDYLTFINGSLPVTVYATVMNDSTNLNDVLNISLTYQNGSIGTISYFANGAKSVPKEYVEIYSHGNTALLNDYKELKIFGSGKPYVKKQFIQDKGQKEEVKSFIDAVKHGKATPIPIEGIFSTTRTCFGVLESIRAGQVVKL